jgi:hypothetical protein
MHAYGSHANGSGTDLPRRNQAEIRLMDHETIPST